MKLLLAKGADPKIATALGVTALHVAAGIGWVEGITYEWSPQATLDAVKILLELGLDPNAQADTGRTALHGAAHKGRADVIQVLVDNGAKLDVRDYGNTDNRGGKLAVHTWQAVDYADGLVRVGVQSAIPHPEAGLLLRKLMTAQGIAAPPEGRRWSPSASPRRAIRGNNNAGQARVSARRAECLRRIVDHRTRPGPPVNVTTLSRPGIESHPRLHRRWRRIVRMRRRQSSVCRSLCPRAVDRGG